MEKQFGNLSDFKGRDVELFRSSDQHNTAVYFMDLPREQKDTAKAYFELLRFRYGEGDHEIYLRFPNTDHFIEILGGGCGSSHGNMQKANGKNIWAEYDKPFTMCSQGNNMVVFFGKIEFALNFNFMEKVASFSKGSEYQKPYPNEVYTNKEEIEQTLSMPYLKLPESVRKIHYCYNTKDSQKYFLVDTPAYNFKYENHRYFVVENGEYEQLNITGFGRARDGGTTNMVLVDSKNNEHKFYSPSYFRQELSATFDEIELIDVTDAERQYLVRLLGIELEEIETDF